MSVSQPTTSRPADRRVDERRPEPVDTETILWHWLREGWKFRDFNRKLTPAQRKEYSDRVKYEMKLMADKDFLDYFAVLSDVVRQAKDRGVAVGPARGSAAASLVCYLLRITEVNPMEYPLMLFERFIDPNRDDLPDIDLDFEDDRRDEVRQIMIEKYGADRVGNIGTFTRFRGKNSIDTVARVYQLPKGDIERAKEFLVERSGGDSRFDASIEDTVEMFPVVKETFDKYPDLYRSLELEGNYQSFGVHAAGLVIGNDSLDHYVAMYTRHNVGAEKKSVKVLSVDKYDGEHLGLMKLDALGLSTMGMISQALEMLGMTLNDLYAIPMDDPDTIEAFRIADVSGIFQFEGRTMKMVCQELKPTTFMDLAAVNALARPGPLHSGSTGDYIAVRHGRQERVDLHPLVAEICDATEGQIIYQEQILQICRVVGKFPWVNAGLVRKIISQKKGEAAFAPMKKMFIDGAAESSIDEKTADAIWRKIITAGTYAFNIAHCVSYSMLGFWAMWLKVHHPTVFYAAQLRKTPHDPKTQKDIALMRDMQDPRFGRSYKVMPPKLGVSGRTWTPVKDGVRAGFEQIPGVGVTTADKIVSWIEENGQPSDWHQLRGDHGGIKGIGVKGVMKIQEFCETPDPFGIDQLAREIGEIKKAVREGDLPGVPFPKHTSDDVPYEAQKWNGVILGRLRNRNLQDMFENYRSREGHDLDPADVKDPDLKESMTLYVEDRQGLMTVKVSRYLYPRLKDDIWGATLNQDYILASVKKYPFLGKTIHVERLWVISP